MSNSEKFKLVHLGDQYGIYDSTKRKVRPTRLNQCTIYSRDQQCVETILGLMNGIRVEKESTHE